MEIIISKNISIDKKYNPFDLNVHMDESDLDCLIYKMFGHNPTRIRIKDKWYDAIPNYELYSLNNNRDGYYHLIYIQINMVNFEYYIGKVNRKSWGEIKRYKGSGVRFKSKYKRHPEQFERFYITSCDTEIKTEEIEREIVDQILLDDPKCLNLVRGGGGITKTISCDKKVYQHNYMKNHPEQYQNMINKAKELYCSGNTVELKERNSRIRNTMNSDFYKKMSRERMIRWRVNNPDNYKKSRENNRRAQQSEITKKKKKDARKQWISENPEKHEQNIKKMIEATQSDNARKKRSNSLKEWNRLNPEKALKNAEKRTDASKEKCQKPVNMINLENGKIIQTFTSQHEAARWLVKNGIAKNTNCVSSISAVCLKKQCTTGYGYRKKAYGFGWEFSEIKDKSNL